METLHQLTSTLLALMTAVIALVGGIIVGILHLTPISPTPAAQVVEVAPLVTPTHFPTAPSTTAAATSSAPVVTKLVANVPSKTTPATSVSTPSPLSTLPPKLVQTKSTDVVNADTRAALVNILCNTRGGGVGAITASGVMVTRNGAILTNAHVGQYFLLHDYPTPGNVICTVRTGSPATTRYTAELIYLPPSWVHTNAATVAEKSPTGTGEDDYAFLRITGTTDGSILPTTFPSLVLTLSMPDAGDPVLLASYPAQFIGGQAIADDLYASSALSTIGEVYTFDDPTHVDVMSIRGAILSQAGSSGGAVVRGQDGALLGIIATATAGTTTATRTLNAITLSHIERSMKKAGLVGLPAFLGGDLAAASQAFLRDTAPALTKELGAALSAAGR